MNDVSNSSKSEILAKDDAWMPSGCDYDHSIHHNPDAKAWADLFIATYPGLADKHDLMITWFANAMMAMYDHLAAERRKEGLDQAVDDLAALVGKLAQKLRKAAPDEPLAEKAVDYLKRKSLLSPLRAGHVEPEEPA